MYVFHITGTCRRLMFTINDTIAINAFADIISDDERTRSRDEVIADLTRSYNDKIAEIVVRAADSFVRQNKMIIDTVIDRLQRQEVVVAFDDTNVTVFANSCEQAMTYMFFDITYVPSHEI